MLKKLTIIFFVDLVTICLLIILINADPSVSIAEVIIIPALVIINLIIGFFLLKSKYKDTAKAFFINCGLTPLIFHFLFSIWFKYYNKENFDNRYFTLVDKNYELTIYKKSDYFSLADITNQKSGSTTGVLFGHYKKDNDTMYFVDNSKRLTMYDKYLIGFPEQNDTIILQR